jgi:hypothetical protein
MSSPASYLLGPGETVPVGELTTLSWAQVFEINSGLGAFPDDGCRVNVPVALASDWTTSNNQEGPPLRLAVVADRLRPGQW